MFNLHMGIKTCYIKIYASNVHELFDIKIISMQKLNIHVLITYPMWAALRFCAILLGSLPVQKKVRMNIVYDKQLSLIRLNLII